VDRHKLTQLERQQQKDRWRARTLGTPVPPPEPPPDDPRYDEFGPIDRFIPLLTAFICGVAVGIALSVLRFLR
jgi:hypothetical protein